MISYRKLSPTLLDAAKALLDRAGYSVNEERKKLLGLDDIESMTIEGPQQFTVAGKRSIEEIVEGRAEGAKLIKNNPGLGVLG